ncbi:MAG: hypothetical protein ACRCYY_20370 [Trueperaceae bacterium]
MWSLSFLLFVLVLVSCGGTQNPTNPTSPTPENPNNPYAAYGCEESPNTNSDNPRSIYDIELGKPYVLQGGSYALFFDIPVPSKVRVSLEGIDAYDSLFVIVGDKVDFQRAGSLFHDAGSASNEAGPPLTEATIESEEPLEVTVSVGLNRFLDDYTLRNDEGKTLFCQPYTVVVTTIP